LALALSCDAAQVDPMDEGNSRNDLNFFGLLKRPEGPPPRVMMAALTAGVLALLVGCVVDLVFWSLHYGSPVGAILGVVLAPFWLPFLLVVQIQYARLLWRVFGFFPLLAISVAAITLAAGIAGGSGRFSASLLNVGMVYGAAFTLAFWGVLAELNPDLVPPEMLRRRMAAAAAVAVPLLLVWLVVFSNLWAPISWK
jgi:hypothetical protein